MNKNTLVSIGLIALALGIFFVYVRPTYDSSVVAAQQQIDSYNAALAAAASYSAKQTELASERNAMSASDLARLTTFLPDGADNVQIILDLDALAARSGLSLADFTTSTPGSIAANTPTTEVAPGSDASTIGAPTGSKVQPIELTVGATGTYGALRAFITGVERSLRLVDLVSLSVKQSNSGVYTYQMVLRLYSLQ